MICHTLQAHAVRFFAATGLSCLVIALTAGGAAAQFSGAGGSPRPPLPPKSAALIDVTGYWVSIVDEDWRWRMMTPPKGDYSSIPLNAEGRKVADTWDPAQDEADGKQCKAYGAAGIMRVPTRLHMTWTDDDTLQIETDAGMQTRLLHFDGSKWQGGEPQWQGDSVAEWQRQRQSRGFVPQFGPPVPGSGGTLKVVTTHMRPGYYRKNGVPYSGNARMIEYFDRIEEEGRSYLILTTVVEDPQYLIEPFITSEQFRLEPNASKWNPQPCKAK
jgi:hypothetical protein